MSIQKFLLLYFISFFFIKPMTTFTKHRTNFRLAKNFDRTLGSDETVQFFRSVHTWPSNLVEYKLLSEVLPSVHAQSYLTKSKMAPSSSVTTHPCDRAFTVQKNLDGYGVHIAIVKYCSNIAKPCCAKSRRWKSSRATSPIVRQSEFTAVSKFFLFFHFLFGRFGETA